MFWKHRLICVSRLKFHTSANFKMAPHTMLVYKAIAKNRSKFCLRIAVIRKRYISVLFQKHTNVEIIYVVSGILRQDLKKNQNLPWLEEILAALHTGIFFASFASCLTASITPFFFPFLPF